MATTDKSKSSRAKELAEAELTPRQKRQQAIAKATTVTFAMEPAVRRFIVSQAKAAGLNMTHYMQKLVEDHVIEAAGPDDALSQRLTGKRAVIEKVIETATALDAAGKFDEHFILTVVQAASKDATFKANYEKAAGGKDAEGTRFGERQRVSLNQQIGRMIKKAVGARSKRGEAGKILRAQVQNEMIATYTLLDRPSDE